MQGHAGTGHRPRRAVQAYETAQDAALNRDGEAKAALPKGCTECLRVLSCGFAGSICVSGTQVAVQAQYQQEHEPEAGY